MLFECFRKTSIVMNRGCDRCRQRKVKCDRTRPTCLRCRRMSVACPGYSEPPFRIIIASDQVDRPEHATSQSTLSYASPVTEPRELLPTNELALSPISIPDVIEPKHILGLLKNESASSLPIELSTRDLQIVFSFLSNLESLFPDRLINQDLCYSLSLRGPLAFQTFIVLPASLFEFPRQNDQSYGLLNINKTLSIVRQRIEQRRTALDTELLISIAKLAQQNSYITVIQNIFFETVNPNKHWLAAVSLLRNSGGPTSLIPNSKEVWLYNWVDLMMLPPSSVDDQHKYSPWSDEITSRTGIADMFNYHLDNLCALLTNVNHARTQIQERYNLKSSQPANSPTILHALQQTISGRDLNQFRNGTHLQAYSQYLALLHIHYAISLSQEHSTTLDAYFTYLDAIFHNEDGTLRQPCLCILAFELLKYDLNPLVRPTESNFSTPSGIWTIAAMQRILKMLSLPAAEKVFVTLLSIFDPEIRSHSTTSGQVASSNAWRDYIIRDLYETRSPASLPGTVPWTVCAWGGPHRRPRREESQAVEVTVAADAHSGGA